MFRKMTINQYNEDAVKQDFLQIYHDRMIEAYMHKQLKNYDVWNIKNCKT